MLHEGLLADRCLEALNTAQAVDIHADETISVQGVGPGNLRVVQRQREGCEGSLIQQKWIGCRPLSLTDEDIISVSTHHLTLIVDASEVGVAGSGIIHGGELPFLVDETVKHRILAVVLSDNYACGVD